MKSTHQSRIDVGDCEKLLVHLMNLLVLQPALFKVSEGEVEQSVATQNAADRALENVGDLIVEDFRSVRVLREKCSRLVRLQDNFDSGVKRILSKAFGSAWWARPSTWNTSPLPSCMKRRHNSFGSNHAIIIKRRWIYCEISRYHKSKDSITAMSQLIVAKLKRTCDGVT